MTIPHAFIVPLVAIATLCGGVLKSVVTIGAEAGFARSQPCDLGAAVLDSATDAEGDADDDFPHDRDWPADGQVHAAETDPACARFIVIRTAPVALRHGRASSSIRGPPARG